MQEEGARISWWCGNKLGPFSAPSEEKVSLHLRLRCDKKSIYGMSHLKLPRVILKICQNHSEVDDDDSDEIREEPLLQHITLSFSFWHRIIDFERLCKPCVVGANSGFSLHWIVILHCKPFSVPCGVWWNGGVWCDSTSNATAREHLLTRFPLCRGNDLHLLANSILSKHLFVYFFCFFVDGGFIKTFGVVSTPQRFALGEVQPFRPPTDADAPS